MNSFEENFDFGGFPQGWSQVFYDDTGLYDPNFQESLGPEWEQWLNNSGGMGSPAFFNSDFTQDSGQMFDPNLEVQQSPYGTAPFAQYTPPAGQNTDILNTLKNGVTSIMGADPRLLATLGIGGIMAIMGFASDGGDKIRTPDGRVVQLSPEERQFMQTMLNQAQQTAAISTPANEALASAAQRNVGNIGQLMDAGLGTLPTQAATQGRVAQGVDSALTSEDLNEILGQDVDISKKANQNLLGILNNSASGGGEGDVSSWWKQQILGGNATGVDPALQMDLEEQKRDAELAALRSGGTGYETSTWYNNQLNNLDRNQNIARDNSRTARAGAATDAYNQTRTTDQGVLDSMYGRSNAGVGTGAKTVAALQTIGQHGAATPAGLLSLLTDKDPTATANAGFAGLGNLGNFQANQNMAANMFNSQTATQNRNMLLGSAGMLFGRGLSRA